MDSGVHFRREDIHPAAYAVGSAAPMSVRLLAFRCLVLAAASVSVSAGASASVNASFNATVSVVLGGTATTPLPHTWKRIFGSGHAALGLRPDYQAQLKQARDELGLVGVRAHGTFDDDMGPIVTAHRTYNFTLLKQLWRSQVDLGLHPVVELSFMPSFLASCSWSVAPGDCHADRGLPCSTDFGGSKKCEAGMAYQGVRETPKDWDDWRHLVQAAVQMGVDTFGLAEVQQWRFEVWNEVCEHGSFEPFAYKCDHFTKTGSGLT